MMDSINGSTQICAVIGDPIQHTLSPRMHNAAFQALGLNFAYVAFHVKDVRRAIEGMRGFNLRGLSVTIPHKVEVMQHLDEIDPLAKKIGAVNTIVNREGHLFGTNTDGLGALKAIEEHERLDGKTVVILGVGGAARGIAFAAACQRKPARLFLMHRSGSEAKANALASDVRAHSNALIAAAELAPETTRDIVREADVIINTTPVGMHPHVDACLLDESLLSERHLVFDTIYNPARTLLLQCAERRFARTINGVPMFVQQGAEQFRLWTEREAPVDVMTAAVEQALKGSA